MKKWLLFFLLFSTVKCFCQNDVLMLEKKGERLQTYGAGTNITFKTVYNQWFTGTIELLRHDSLFVGGQIFHYKEITALNIERTGLNYQVDGALLMIAGGGVLLLGAVNGLYRGDQAKTWYKTGSFITAGALLIAGFFIFRAHHKVYFLGKKFTLEYLSINPNKL